MSNPLPGTYKTSGRDSVPGFIARSESDAGCVTRSLEDWQRIMEESGAPKGA